MLVAKTSDSGIVSVEEMKWVDDNAAKGNTFAASLQRFYRDKGFLTEGQRAVIKRNLGCATTQPAARGQVSAPLLMQAFDNARSNGAKRMQMRFEKFTASLAPSNGVNAGAVYIKDAAGTYCGKIRNGTFMPTNECTLSVEEINAVLVDPVQAAIQYGKKTGNCSICGRELTLPESIARGIGPDCATKFG